MSINARKIYLVSVSSLFMFSVASYSVAAEKRCTAQGKKVECPVQTDEALKAAQDAYEDEALNMARGKAGSAYGIEPFDYLTGVGKRTEDSTLTEGDSGYGSGTGKTEMWDRVKKPEEGEAVYNQWTHNWSPTFKKTLVPGADPNEGKQWYYTYCIGCHGWTLHGDGPNALSVQPRPRILTEGSYMNKKTNLELFAVIKGGGEAVDLSPSMPAWGNLLQDQDIWNVIAWIRAMADVERPKTLKEYLNPKSSFKPIAGDVNALNAAEHPDFQEYQELNEATLAGRGGDIKGGGYVEGGLRKAPTQVDKKVGSGY
ncbi:MAG: cytochrome c [Desulfobacterales bacterium]|nr:cytochrome c [Desulfobacterales bacterium]